jgi:hypothetical protein
MAIIDFPLSPQINDTYSFGSYSWTWDGNGWASNTSPAASGPTGPAGPTGLVTATDPLSYNSYTQNIILKIRSGGGIVGDNSGLYIDSSIVPTLSGINNFTGTVNVSGNLTGPNFDFTITPLDDIANYFTGNATRFRLTYQGTQIFLANPFRLLITIDGIIQSVSFPEYVWRSPLKRSGFWLDSGGYLAFFGPVSKISTFSGRIMSGEVTTKKTTLYPFKASDILLGD